jgi:putative DNA primase/helicase
MIKGSASGEVTRYTMRSMFMMSSISTALKQGADRSRFAQLTLKNLSEQNAAERSSQWALLEKDLDAYITEEVAHALLLALFHCCQLYASLLLFILVLPQNAWLSAAR